jgi:hypothetical protein
MGLKRRFIFRSGYSHFPSASAQPRYFYGSDAAANQQLRESVAQAMRHSVREAQRTYDRRNVVQKKHKGLKVIGEC